MIFKAFSITKMNYLHSKPSILTKFKVYSLNSIRSYSSICLSRFSEAHITFICHINSIFILKRFGGTSKDVSNISRALVIYTPRLRSIIPYLPIPDRNLPVIVSNTPISLVRRSTLPPRRQLDEWERSTLLRNISSPAPTHRLFHHPLGNYIYNEIVEFMQRYSHITVDSVTNIINRFRNIQFEPGQIGSDVYNRYMELFQRFWNYVSPIIPTNTAISPTITSTSTSETSSNTPITSTSTSTRYEISTFDFDPENITNSTLNPSTTTITTTSSTNTPVEIDEYETPITYNNKPKNPNNSDESEGEPDNPPLLISPYSLPPISNNEPYTEAKIDIFDVRNLSNEEIIQYVIRVENILLNYERNQIFQPEDLDILERFQKIIQYPNTVEQYKCDQNLYNRISALIAQYAPPRSMISPVLTRDEEEYKKLRHYTDKEAKRVISLLSRERPINCNHPDDYNDLINIDEETLALLEEGYQSLHTPHWIELLRRSGILVNNDAQSSMGVVKEGETDKLKKEAVERANQLFGNTGDKPTDIEIEAIKKSIDNGEFIEGYYERDEELDMGNAVILSGHDLHPLVFIQDPTHEGFYLCVAMMTSANDKGTEKISDTQQYGGATNKAQYIRVAKQLIRVPKDKVRKDLHVKKDVQNAKKIITKAIEKNLGDLENSPISSPILFNRMILTTLAIITLKEKIADNKEKLKKLLKELNSLEESKRIIKLNMLKTKTEKDKKIAKDKTIDNNMPQPFKVLQNIRDIIKQNIDKIKEQQKAHENNMKGKQDKINAKAKQEKNKVFSKDNKNDDSDKK